MSDTHSDRAAGRTVAQRLGGIPGKLYPEQSGRHADCFLVVRGASARELHFMDTDNRIIARAKRSEVRLEARVGNTPRKLHLPKDAIFETRDNDAMDAAFPAPFWDFVARNENFGWRLALFAVLGLVLMGAVFRFALPALVSLAVWMTPPVFLETIDRGNLQSMDRTIASPSTLPDDVQAKLRGEFNALVAELGQTKANYNLQFRDIFALGPNALAMPGGTVLITDQLVEFLKDSDPDVLAGIMAHEIGHVERKHSLRQLYRAAGIAAVIMLVAGDPGSIVEELLIEANLLLSLSYSRASEADADRYAVALMAKAGRDPAALADFFEKLKSELQISGEDSWFSTHPGPDNRIETIRDLARDPPPLPAGLGSNTDQSSQTFGTSQSCRFPSTNRCHTASLQMSIRSPL